MTDGTTDRRISRRQLLAWGGGTLAALGAGGVLLRSPGARASGTPSILASVSLEGNAKRRLVATDGFISLPGRRPDDDLGPVYIFGFVDAATTLSVKKIVQQFKGKVQFPAPILYIDEDDDFYLTLTNAGFLMRPDLDDSHTIHWHGFRNATAIFDGVPEVSIAVPPNRDFPYFYKPHDPGTYMYHCHFEDVEHVQMGMTGIVFVRPSQNTNSQKYAYNDGVPTSDPGSTAYDREFALLLNELDVRPHDGLLAVQEFHWTEYDPRYWIINGRSYPDTTLPNEDPSLPSQPVSSLIQVEPGDRVLLRLVNLGYQQHAMYVEGTRLKVVGEDATLLRGPGGANLMYETDVVYIGPGESRDCLFTAPNYSASLPGGSDGQGDYNRYMVLNRNYQTLNNDGAPGLGGMATEVRVYQSNLPSQGSPNETYT